MPLVLPLVAALALTLAAPAAAKFPQHVDATVQPNGTVSETSSTVPKDGDSATMAVAPKASDSDEYFQSMRAIIPTTTKKQRVLICVALYKAFTDSYGDQVEFKDTQPEFRLLFLAACLELALQNATNAHAAATTCPTVRAAVPMKISHSSGSYTITVDGTMKKPARPAVRVRCRRVGDVTRIKLRPRKRSRSLRSVVGKKLAIGFYNTGDSPIHMRTTFNVK